MQNHNCRLCDSTEVDMVLKMPELTPVDNFRYYHDPLKNLPAFSMDLYLCKFCGHAQLLNVVDPNILFSNYIYTSSSSPDLEKHFEDYSIWLSIKYSSKQFNKVLDIGSNDGLFLSKLKKYDYSVLGVDASKQITEISNKKGILSYHSFFNFDSSEIIKVKFGTFDIITANNVFSHTNNLKDFTIGIRNILNPNGLFIFEVSYLLNLITDKVIDYIYHEHLAHHSLLPLKKFFDSINLKMIDYQKIAVKGGSIRCVVAHKDSEHIISDNITTGIKEEFDFDIYNINKFHELQLYFNTLKIKINSIIEHYVSINYIICAYGASATSVVLNKILDIEKNINFIIDDNPVRQGRLSPGSLIPIISSEKFNDNQNNFLCIISAWRFSDLILQRNTNINDNITFLIPHPTIKII
jgi:SAM-dependent methyltransferase